MKEIIIVGYNNFTKEVIKKIKAKKNIKIILDDLTDDTSFDGIAIDKISNINKYKNNSDIYVIDDMPYFDEIYHKLYNNNINKINVIVKEDIDEVDENILKNKYIHKYNLRDKPVLRYIETHIMDVCNIKCNGCTHFSNICDKDKISFNIFKKDMDLLEKKYDVTMIRLMGGEPLLKKNLNEYIDYTRKKFPRSTIFVVTNGMLITKMNDSTIESIKKNNIIINVSLYKPTLKIIDNIEKFLSENQIRHRYGRGNKQILEEDFITKFHTCLSINEENKKAKLSCYNQYCWFLRNGKIYKCPYPALIDILNEKYNLNFKDEESYCDLLEHSHNWKNIEKLSNVNSFCKYCRNKVKEYEWNNNKPELSYYLLDDK